jgi:sulfur-oxidizing protein SoxB
MHITDRRAFLQLMAAAGAGMFAPAVLRAQQGMEQFYDLPAFGNISFMHITDMQAQWKPLYYREPAGLAEIDPAGATPPNMTGDALLQYYNLMIGSAQAYAFSSADYAASAADYGMLGGVAHLASLIDIVKRSRKQAWLLDGGNGALESSAPWATDDGATAIDHALGVDLGLPDRAYIQATAASEHTGLTQPSDSNVRPSAQGRAAHYPSIAHNVFDPVNNKPLCAPYILQKRNGITVAIIGQAAHNELFARDGCGENTKPDAKASVKDQLIIRVDEHDLQRTVAEVRDKGAQAVLLLSRAGVDADLQLATRVTGIDVILGGRSGTPLPEPILVSNKKGKTAVTNAGAQGRFLAVLDLDIGKGGLVDFRYSLLPVVASFVQADSQMAKRVDDAYATANTSLSQKIAMNEGLLYRRGTFNGTWDELLLQAMLQRSGAQIALYPGYRWGSTLLPGAAITREDMINQLALGETQMCWGTVHGRHIHAALEAAAQALFDANAYKRSEQDMVRTGGLHYQIDPDQEPGQRITNVMVGNQPLLADEKYKVATWGLTMPFESDQVAPTEASGADAKPKIGKSMESKDTVQANVTTIEPEEMPARTTLTMLEVLENYLKQRKTIPEMKTYEPEIVREKQRG